ncbi:MAG: DNA-directed RNA polymerase, subunit E'' [Candidatus Pacearchaeota archaeon]|nr:DNA-directed RNA polymerase, subunit E'' [Candidatus Pacearchaeota archaeon]
MAKGKKVCKHCKAFVEEDKCPVCESTNLVENWKGRVIILNPEKSEIAKKLEIKRKGNYALKIS